MAIAFTKINSFVENLAEKQIDLSGTLKFAITNTAHNAAWDELADLTEIVYTNLSTRALTVGSSSQTLGVYTLKINSIVLTATGNVGPFRYIYIYDDGSTGDKLIGYFDLGKEYSMVNTDTLNFVFDQTNGVLTITTA